MLRVSYKHFIIFLILVRFSCRAKNEVDTAVGTNNATHFADLEGVCGVLKRLLHLSRTEVAQVAAIAVRRAVRVLLRKLRELQRKRKLHGDRKRRERRRGRHALRALYMMKQDFLA